LAADLGEALGGGAHLRTLRRTAIGSFGLDEARPLEEPLVLPMETAVRDHRSVTVDAATAADVRHGKVLSRAALGVDAEGEGPWAVLDEAGSLLAMYEPHKADTVKPSVVLAPA
jgi:tRNA pseudouridine55 synthase